MMGRVFRANVLYRRAHAIHIQTMGQREIALCSVAASSRARAVLSLPAGTARAGGCVADHAGGALPSLLPLRHCIVLHPATLRQPSV